MRILLVDDDEQLMEILASKLINQRYAVDIANTGEMGWEFVLLFDFDLVVLDWMLPDVNGVELCQQIRAKGYQMPIMLLTARDRQNDKILALDSGADDYVVKPFDFDELTARIRVLLRREIGVSSPVLEWGDLNLDPKTHEVYYQGRLLPLTPKEYSALELLMRHPQQVFSPRAIIDNLWAGEDIPGEEAVRTHIKGLRKKLKAAGMAKDTIETIYGVGYRLKSDEDALENDSSQTAIEPKQDRLVKSEQVSLIRELKMLLSNDISRSINPEYFSSKFKDLAVLRLANLKRAIAALSQNNLSEEIQQGRDLAHKLAGSLGCFGFPEGSRIAKQIEILLNGDLIEPTHLKQISKLITALDAKLQHQPRENTFKDVRSKNISVLIIDRTLDTELDRQLIAEANFRGMKTHMALDLTQAQRILERESIDAVLHKIVFPDGKDLKFIERLHQSQPNIPIAAIAETLQLSDRLNFVRGGGSLILQHPVEPISAESKDYAEDREGAFAVIAITALSKLLDNLGNAAKVLIIDDDPQVLLSLKMSLEPWGFEITTLDKSTQFWSVLESVKPDLLILDIEMPDLNGIELCQIVRSDRYWQHLPVLFLSVHQDGQTQNQAFKIGADDYVCKPAIGSVLANRILNRLRRSRN